MLPLIRMVAAGQARTTAAQPAAVGLVAIPVVAAGRVAEATLAEAAVVTPLGLPPVLAEAVTLGIADDN
jgi:hypothetical protein